MKFEGGFLEPIKIFSKILSSVVLAEVGRKSIDLSRPSKKYDFGQYNHAINFFFLSEMGFWIFKSKKDATIKHQKEDATVKHTCPRAGYIL